MRTHNFLGNESLQYNYISVPKALMVHSMFRGISSDAKLLYGLMLNRMYYSQRNGWVDEKNCVYIIYTWQEICEQLGCSKNTATKILHEMEERKLIVRIKRGRGLASLIYPQNFVTLIDDYTRTVESGNSEQDAEEKNPESQNLGFKESGENCESQSLGFKGMDSENCDSQNLGFKKKDPSESQNLEAKNPKTCDSRIPKSVFQESQKLGPNNIKYNKYKNIYNTSVSQSKIQCKDQEEEKEDRQTEETVGFLDVSKFDVRKIAEETGSEEGDILPFLSLLREFANQAEESGNVQIGSKTYTAEQVHQCMEHLGDEHIIFAIRKMRSSERVKNVRNYFLVIVLHAPADLRLSTAVNQGKCTSGFNNFTPRAYDYEALEKQLLTVDAEKSEF